MLGPKPELKCMYLHPKNVLCNNVEFRKSFEAKNSDIPFVKAQDWHFICVILPGQSPVEIGGNCSVWVAAAFSTFLSPAHVLFILESWDVLLRRMMKSGNIRPPSCSSKRSLLQEHILGIWRPSENLYSVGNIWDVTQALGVSWTSEIRLLTATGIAWSLSQVMWLKERS